MVLDNIYRGPVLRIALGTTAIVILLLALNYGAEANPSPITQTNNSSSETGITYTQAVPFAKESIKEIINRESKKPTSVQKQSVIPFHKAPPPKKISGTAAPLKPQSAVQNQLTSLLAPVLSSSFPGITSDGLRIPPDTMGAAGPSHLMEITNEKVGFFNKSTGTLSSSVSLQAFWLSLGADQGQPANFPFDPRALYDQNNNRFIVVTMGLTTSSQSSWLMIAVSNTSDPTGNWTKWAIDADNNNGNFADFPGLGVDANNVYVTANMFSFSDVYNYSQVWVIPKTQLLTGSSNNITWTEFSNPTGSGFTMQPAHVFGSSSTEYLINEGYYITGTPPRRFLNINNITFPDGTPTWANLGLIEVNSYPTSGFPNAPQSGSNFLIATNDASLLNAVFRNGYLWTTHTVANNANTKTEVAWYQINPADASPSSPGTPIQQGRISDTNRWYYFPSIAVNSNGNVGIGFSGSSTSEYAGAYYTARNASDAPGTMQSVAVLKAGLATYDPKARGFTQTRWGDYSATAVDPLDDASFWTVQEYAGTSNLWGTWWGKFSLTSTGIPAITGFAPSSPVSDTAGASRTFNITVNQTVNVTWYINGTQVQFNGSVTNATYTNTSAAIGFWNITAIAQNGNGTTSQIWLWNVTAASAVTKNLTVFVRGTDNAVWYQNGSGSAWSGWQSLGGNINSNVTATSSGSNITIFARGTDNAVWYQNWNGSAWSGWQSLGGAVTSEISATSSGSNITIFARGGDNAVWTQNWNGSAWGGWQSLGGYVISNISSSSDAVNITIFALGGDNSLWTRNWDGSAWNDWQGLGGTSTSDPDSVSLAGRTYVFVRGTDNAVWYQNGSGNVWSGWQSLGGTVTSNIASSSDAVNITIFALGGDNGLWTRNWDGNAWSGWQSLGGAITSDPDSVSSPSGTYVFVRGTDNSVWYQNGNGNIWSGWQGLGGSTTGNPKVTSG